MWLRRRKPWTKRVALVGSEEGEAVVKGRSGMGRGEWEGRMKWRSEFGVIEGLRRVQVRDAREAKERRDWKRDAISTKEHESATNKIIREIYLSVHVVVYVLKTDQLPVWLTITNF